MATDEDLCGHKRYVVALSDVHLGTLAPTVWYQRHLHEAYLLHLLGWVVDQAEHIRELVLLGDIVDFWTYPAEVRPPAFADIAACHPVIFGADGALARVLDALDGEVTYVPGNHDQGITADEVASIRSHAGHHVRLVEDVPYLPVPGLAMAHGHHDTLFNAPTTAGPFAPLPLGYFVTRALPTRWTQGLDEGQTVAELAGQGAPNGIDLRSLMGVASGVGARSVAATVLDFVASATAVSPVTDIVLPDGSTANLLDARAAYEHTWTEWADANGGGVAGQSAAGRATLADFDGTYLGWFAQRMAFEHDCDLVVMGHTHVPVGGLDASLVNYINTGFDCPSQPDLTRELSPQHVTFGVVDTRPTDDDPDAAPFDPAIWAVSATDEGLRCHPIEVPTASIVSGATMDYSCYVVVDNQFGTSDLELVSSDAAYGTFVVAPPARIAAGAEGRFWIQDLLGAAGSDGRAVYRRADDPDGVPIELWFTCPTVGTNGCSGPGSFATRTGHSEWREERVALWGHPFFVEFEVI